MAIVAITYTVPANHVRAAIEEEERRLERQLNEARDDILKFIENAQIKAYTSSANPSLPPGSRYVRTFNLRDASETERTGTQLPNISGEWRVNLSKARYGAEVLGSRGEQARIHRGRWKSREQVEREAQAAAPGIVEEKLRR